MTLKIHTPQRWPFSVNFNQDWQIKEATILFLRKINDQLERKDLEEVDFFAFDGEGFMRLDERKSMGDYSLPFHNSILHVQARLPMMDSYLQVESIESKKYLLDVQRGAKLKDIEGDLGKVRNMVKFPPCVKGKQLDLQKFSEQLISNILKYGSVIECKRDFIKTLTIMTNFPGFHKMTSSLKKATIIDYIENCKAKLFSKFKPSLKKGGIRADLRQIKPQIFINGKPIGTRQELLTSDIIDNKTNKQVKTILLRYCVRVSFFDVNTEVKKTLPGRFEINEVIKEKLMMKLRSTYGLQIQYQNKPIDHSSFDLSLLRFPLSLEEEEPEIVFDTCILKQTYSHASLQLCERTLFPVLSATQNEKLREQAEQELLKLGALNTYKSYQNDAKFKQLSLGIQSLRLYTAGQSKVHSTYAKINNELSATDKIHEPLKIPSYLASIYRQLPNLQGSGQNEENPTPFKSVRRFLYRGIEAPFQEFPKYRIGERLFFPAFSSASRSLQVAKTFAGKDGYIFIIRVSYNAPYHNLNLQSCSLFPEEKEILLFPNFYFEVMRLKKKKKITYIELKEISYQNILSLQKLKFPKIVWVSETFATKKSKKIKKAQQNEDLMLLREISKSYRGMNVQACGSVQQLIENYGNWGRQILIICQGRLVDGLISQIDQFSKVDYAVVVYCMDREKYERKLESHKLGWRVIISIEHLRSFIAQWFEQQ